MRGQLKYKTAPRTMGKIQDKPPSCYCSDLHVKTEAVCLECWKLGYRYNSPDHQRVWWHKED